MNKIIYSIPAAMAVAGITLGAAACGGSSGGSSGSSQAPPPATSKPPASQPSGGTNPNSGNPVVSCWGASQDGDVAVEYAAPGAQCSTLGSLDLGTAQTGMYGDVIHAWISTSTLTESAVLACTANAYGATWTVYAVNQQPLEAQTFCSSLQSQGG